MSIRAKSATGLSDLYGRKERHRYLSREFQLAWPPNSLPSAPFIPFPLFRAASAGPVIQRWIWNTAIKPASLPPPRRPD